MKKIALLLDQEDNPYQQLLAKGAAVRATHHKLALLPPSYAGGSSFVQLNQLMACTKGDDRPDGVLLMAAGGESNLPGAKHVLRAGVSLVFINRQTAQASELKDAYPDVLTAAVSPDQEQIGRIQAEQCRRLLPKGGFVLLITGTPSTSSAIDRRAGFLSGVGKEIDVHTLEGMWTEESAFRALADWVRVGAERSRPVSLIVCQNDQMARGARRAQLEHKAKVGELAPLIGCDGLPAEGQHMVRQGELRATVIMPATTPEAVDALAAFWATGERRELALVSAESFPPLAQLGPQ